MSGNLCRCGAYAGITEAVLEAQRELAELDRRHVGMNSFDYVRPDDDSRGRRGRLRARRRLSRRRHQPARPDEGRRRPPEPPRRHQPPAGARPDRAARRTAAFASARWCATPISRMTRTSPDAFPPSRKRCCPAPRRSFATPRRSAAICCSARAAPISTTSRAPATNASPAPAATRAAATTRLHAVLGWSESCIATNPSDFCVPLVALDAVVEIEGKAGRREVRARETSTACPATRPSATACSNRAS